MWVLDFRAAGSTHVLHCKLVPKSPSHVAVSQKEQERGEVKNTSNCCRRIEETPARPSVKAAWLHAWSQLTLLNERQYSLSGDCRETKRGYLTVVTCLAVNFKCIWENSW